MDRAWKFCKDYKFYFGAAAATLLAAHYALNVAEKPRIYYKDGKDSVVGRIISKLNIVREYYLPTFWCVCTPYSLFCSDTQYSGDGTTVMGALLRTTPHVDSYRETIELKDGGKLALDWFGQTGTQSTYDPAAPTLVFLPGLTGDSSAPYIRHLIINAHNRGWRCCVMNYRGSAGIPLQNSIIYSASWTEDIRYVSELISDRFPSSSLIGIAFSLGSNILTKCVCEDGSKTRFSELISVSNPYDCEIASEFMSSNKLYDQKLAKGCVALFESKKNELMPLLQEAKIEIDVDALVKSQGMYEYDTHFTSKVFGFPSVEEYYRTASCVRYFDNLKIPAFFLSARDDPICCAGHVAFLEGIWPSRESWSDRVIIDIIEQSLSELKPGKPEMAPNVT